MRKVLVANRSEIAVRVMRAAHELDLLTVGVYTPEDRGALHRTKAGEAYQLGEPGHPVRGYLDVDALLEVAPPLGRRRAAPRLRLPVRERGARRGLRRARASPSSARPPTCCA